MVMSSEFSELRTVVRLALPLVSNSELSTQNSELVSFRPSRSSRENLPNGGFDRAKIPLRYSMETDLIQQSGTVSP